MKRLYTLTCLLLACSTALFAQLSGTVTVGTSGMYPDLTSASGLFNAINLNGMNGNVTVSIVSDITEPGTYGLNQRTEFGGPFLLTIRPNSNVMRTITGAIGGGLALIRFTGADRVIIDGRDPSNSSFDYSNRYLTFSNTYENATPAGEGIVFSFSGGAIDNSLRSIIIEGNDANVNRGVVFFGGGGTVGNNNIVVEYCDIKNSSLHPSNGLYSSGSFGTPNQNNTIRYNRIYDFFFGAGTVNVGRGIFLSSNNDNWTIENNSIYQTSPITNTASKDIYGIAITSSGTFYINNNYIGGDSPLAAVSSIPWTSSNSSSYIRSRLIWVEPGSGTTTAEISGNVLTNIDATSHSATAPTLLVGIFAHNCNCTIEDNYIGSHADGTGSIAIADNTDGGTVIGIQASGTQPVVIQENAIQNFAVSNTGATPSTSALFRGIDLNVSSTTYSTVLKNSIVKNTVTSKPSGVQYIFSGINTGTAGVRANITKNEIGSLSDNTLANSVIINACITCPSEYEIIGINANTTNNYSNVDKNKIGYIVATGTSTVNYRVTGITAGANVSSVQRNTIGNLRSNSNFATISGIAVGSSDVNLSLINNMITLGSSVTADAAIYGFYNFYTNTTTLSLFANSVVITGASGGSSATTSAFFRFSNSPVNIKSNILFNNRSGGSGNYALALNNLTNFTNTSSDNNLLFNANAVAKVASTDYDFATWQSVADANSRFSDLGTIAASPNGKFISIASGDLRIPEDGSTVVDDNIVDRGASVVTEDIDGAQRLNIPDIGASEVLITWLGGSAGNETDWYTAANWSGNVVPACGGRDRIKISNASFQPDISSPVTVKELVVIEGATVVLSGAGSISQCTDGIAPYGVVINGSLVVSGSQDIELIGNFTQNNSFDAGSGTVTLSGTNAQQISGDDQFSVYNLVIDGGSAKNITQNVVVGNLMTFVTGIVNTSSNGYIIFGPSGSYTGASDGTHINGPAGKQTNSMGSFTFPIGKSGRQRELSITATNTPLTTFTAEYFSISALDTYGSVDDGSLETISDVEYWILNRSGITDATVSLTWNERSGVSANPGSPGRADLRVIRWDGSRWINHGGNSIAGTQSAGSLTSDLITAFSPFTLGSVDPINPLPINLKSFKAYAIDGRVKLVWTTSSELDNDYFTIENSKSGEFYQAVTKVKGSGTTDEEHTYVAWDNAPYSGLSYYRLKQTDLDGVSKTFRPVAVDVDPDSQRAQLVLSPNPVQQKDFTALLHSFNEQADVEVSLHDMSGYEIARKKITTDETGYAEIIFENDYPAGLYLVKAKSGVRSLTQKIVIAR
jgi:hypothetical protein